MLKSKFFFIFVELSQLLCSVKVFVRSFRLNGLFQFFFSNWILLAQSRIQPTSCKKFFDVKWMDLCFFLWGFYFFFFLLFDCLFVFECVDAVGKGLGQL